MKRAHAPGLVMLGIVAACGCRESAGLHGAAAPATHAGEEAPAAPGAPAAHAEAGAAGRPAVMSRRRRLSARAPIVRPDCRALVITGPGQEHSIDAEAAEDAGYTLVDFSDDWTPTSSPRPAAPDGQPLANRYRRIFIGLANDHPTKTASRCRPAPRTTSSSTASSRRCRCSGRDSSPTRSIPATTKRASRR